MTRVLITSALPYINGVKHLGNLVGSMLPADAYARFCRALGIETLFVCATDEHGTPAELAASAAGQEPAEYCAHMHNVHKDLGERFGLSWDVFGRSSSPYNHELTQQLYRDLRTNGYIEERLLQQVYSPVDGRFLPDRYVIGTCPHCGYDKARGDQCENCTALLDPTDLLQPRSAVSGSTALEVRSTKHLFLRQSALVPQLRAFINERKAVWPALVTSIAEKWLNEGLRDRCITRDLSWGVAVPDIPGKVFYVWFDAPIAYIAATREGGFNVDRWWKRDAGAADVHYVQFMAKDNVPFHTIGFPATLIGAGGNWVQPDFIKGFNWLTYYGGKFSTSQGRGVFMNAAIELFPADYWRWYLLSNAPEGADSAFTWGDFQIAVNKDLADVFGNFINRTLTFCRSKFASQVPAGGAPGEAEEAFYTEAALRLQAYTQAFEAVELRRACTELRALWSAGNVYLQTAAPWTSIKSDPAQAACAVRTALNAAALFAAAARPIIPALADKVGAALGVDLSGFPTDVRAEYLAPGAAVSVPEVLVTKVDDARIAELEARFA